MIEPYDYDKLKQLVKDRDVPALKQFMKDNDLVVDHGAIVSRHIDEYTKGVDFYDIQQHIRKIMLNSSYGATLADTSGLYDRRIGASITLSGRNITRHMSSKAVQELTGDYTYLSPVRVINDTDSTHRFCGIDAKKNGIDFHCSIENLYEMCSQKEIIGEKEYGYDSDIEVLTYNKNTKQPEYMPIEYVYRHKVNKPMWEITSEDGQTVKITNDHSIMVERNGELIEVKPKDIQENDILLVLER